MSQGYYTIYCVGELRLHLLHIVLNFVCMFLSFLFYEGFLL